MDYMTALQNGPLPGSGVPIQQQNLGDFQMAIRNWLGQRGQYLPGNVQGWMQQRPMPQNYMAQGQGPFQGAGNIGDLMAQHPGRNWHPGMMRAQQYQNGM